MYGDAFDRLFDRGREAVLAGTHQRDALTTVGGRWGITVVLIPDARCLRRLDAVTAEAVPMAGDGHWPTGSAPSAHLTVRALEPRREPADIGDPAVKRYAAALQKAGQTSHPIRLRFRGITLTPSGIMACGWPANDAADDFAANVADALGDDGWFEAEFTRDIWYAMLVHFTGPIANPTALIDWVSARRQLEMGEMRAAAAELLQWRCKGGRPARDTLVRTPLSEAI